MYKIIGADGKPYGPVSREQIVGWLAEYRVNGQTMAQAEGSADWKPLSAFPEFAEALNAKAPPPLATNLEAPPDPEGLAARILAADYHLDIWSCLSRSWDLLLRHFWLMVGASFVVGLIQGVIGLLAGVCMGGLYYLFLKLIRGERAQFADAFAGFSLAFIQLFLAGLVSGLLTAVGFLFCILPGIYLAVAWLFAVALVIDKKMEFWAAMEVSRKVVTRHWWVFFGLVLVNFGVILCGVLVCIVGVFIAQTLVLGAMAYAYEDVFCGETAAVNQPAA